MMIIAIQLAKEMPLLTTKQHTIKLEGKPGILEIKIYYKVFKIK